MDYTTSIQASMWLMIIAQTVTAIDMPTKQNPRKLPSPGAYLTTMLVWIPLHLADDAGYGRPAAAMGWVVAAAALVLGPTGKVIVGMFDGVANNFQVAQAPQATPPTRQPGSTAPVRNRNPIA